MTFIVPGSANAAPPVSGREAVKFKLPTDLVEQLETFSELSSFSVGEIIDHSLRTYLDANSN